jgi:hypothetical protein
MVPVPPPNTRERNSASGIIGCAARLDQGEQRARHRGERERADDQARGPAAVVRASMSAQVSENSAMTEAIAPGHRTLRTDVR